LRIKIKDFLSDKEFEILKSASTLLTKLNLKGYLVGGMVRDLIQGNPNLDIDITVEEDGGILARELARELKGELTLYESFMTATIQAHDRLIDIATTRKEYYAAPGSLPEVSFGSLMEDMFRRDFTINALALSLREENFGEVMDLVGGGVDLQHKRLRVLHPKSFTDDPTRILRGFRFAGRFGYHFEPDTLFLLKKALEANVFKTVSHQRVATELKLMMVERNAPKIFNLFLRYPILESLGFNMRFKDNLYALLKKVSRMKKVENPYLIYTLILTWEVPKEALEDVLVRLQMPRSVIHNCLMRPEGVCTFRKLLENKKGLTDYEIYKALKIYDPTIFVLLGALVDQDGKRIIRRLFKAKNKAKIRITGDDIKGLGIRPGIIYRQIFGELERLRLEDKIRTKKQEINFVKEFKRDVLKDELKRG
jgi:tRNA nucleotidyltransferase (CCA-adding enzyme)